MLVDVGHRAVKAVKDLIEFAGFGCEPQGFDVFDTDFVRSRLLLEDLHDLCEKLPERHGPRIVGAIHQVGLHVGRDQFEDFDRGGAKLISEGKRVRVDGGLGGAIRGRERKRQKCQAGGDVENRRARLLFEVWQERRREADGAKKVGGDNGFGIGKIGLLSEQVFRAHDAGIVDEDIQRGKLGDGLSGKVTDSSRILDIEQERLHAGVGGGGLVERVLPPAGNDDWLPSA